MKRPLTLCCLLLLCGLALAQVPQTPAAEPRPAADSVLVHLSPQVPSRETRLRWSPKGAKLRLSASGDGLDGALRLGPTSKDRAPRPLALRLSRGVGAAHFDSLWIDLDGDGRRAPAEELVTTVSENRGKFWSSFETTLELPLAGDAGTRSYPLSLWYVEDPTEPAAAPVLRWSRRGWHQGRAVLGKKSFWVLITESTLDGVFDERDAWSLSSEEATLVSRAGSRSLGRHAWLGEEAFRVLELDPDGLWLRLEPFDPGITRAAEEAAEDALAADRAAERAAAPLAFEHDFEAAAERAARTGKPLFVDFETTWCGPCKQMDRWVYSSEKVVAAAARRGLVCVKIDGDERRDLKQRFAVEAFPTMILLDAAGDELDRRVGYQGVAAMAEFLTEKK